MFRSQVAKYGETCARRKARALQTEDDVLGTALGPLQRLIAGHMIPFREIDSLVTSGVAWRLRRMSLGRPDYLAGETKQHGEDVCKI